MKHLPARILSVNIIPNRDVDLLEKAKDYFDYVAPVIPTSTLVLSGQSNLLYGDSIYALNANLLSEEDVASVAIILLVSEDSADGIYDNSFDVNIMHIEPDDVNEIFFYKQLKKKSANQARSIWRVPEVDGVKKNTVKLESLTSADRIMSHIEELRKKEIVHRFNSLNYAIAPSKREKLRSLFARYMIGETEREKITMLTGGNSVAISYLEDIDKFLADNPNYAAAFSALLKLENPTIKEIQIISEEFSIPSFELSYFSLKAR